MPISRREFMSMSAVALCAAPPPVRRRESRVLDLSEGCVQRESMVGFARTGMHPCSQLGNSQECLFHIVPAATSLPDDLISQLSASVRNGRWLIFESAAGFGGFEAQRRQLAEHFGLMIEPPVDLWAAGAAVPYVHYRWPIDVKVRDFSRVVPVSTGRAQIIAAIGGLPVAARLGTFIFLGSPIGPSLLAGDREAHLWIDALIQHTAPR
jgi:hypothetical protein